MIFLCHVYVNRKLTKKKQGIYVLVDRRISNLSVERQRRWAEFNGDGLWFLAFISFIGYRESVDGPKPDPLKSSPNVHFQVVESGLALAISLLSRYGPVR